MYRFYTWAIDIDDLPINSGDFPLRYVKNQQRISTIGSRLHRYTLVFLRVIVHLHPPLSGA